LREVVESRIISLDVIVAHERLSKLISGIDSYGTEGYRKAQTEAFTV